MPSGHITCLLQLKEIMKLKHVTYEYVIFVEQKLKSTYCKFKKKPFSKVLSKIAE